MYAQSIAKKGIKVCPQTVSVVLDTLELIDKDINRAFTNLLEIFELAQKESSSLLIVLLDEFQRLIDYNLSSPIDIFREKIMFQKKIWYIISGSAVGMMNRIISSSDSPLYGHFEMLRVGEFSYEDSREFLLNRLYVFSL
ncbi:MAG: hypothetical protein AB1297_04475 [bacterium]